MNVNQEQHYYDNPAGSKPGLWSQSELEGILGAVRVSKNVLTLIPTSI
jgi:hypothetical protein